MEKALKIHSDFMFIRKEEYPLGVSFNYSDLVTAKKYLYDKNSKNTDRTKKVDRLIKAFVQSFSLYGKNQEVIEVLYKAKLFIYPIKYLHKILDVNYWKQDDLPKIWEIEIALKHCDDSNSKKYYEINQITLDDTRDYDDEL